VRKHKWRFGRGNTALIVFATQECFCEPTQRNMLADQRHPKIFLLKSFFDDKTTFLYKLFCFKISFCWKTSFCCSKNVHSKCHHVNVSILPTMHALIPHSGNAVQTNHLLKISSDYLWMELTIAGTLMSQGNPMVWLISVNVPMWHFARLSRQRL